MTYVSKSRSESCENLLSIQTLEAKSLCLGDGHLNFNKCYVIASYADNKEHRYWWRKQLVIDVGFELMDLRRAENLETILVFKGPR